jgi:hypothetical protein
MTAPPRCPQCGAAYCLPVIRPGGPPWADASTGHWLCLVCGTGWDRPAATAPACPKVSPARYAWWLAAALVSAARHTWRDIRAGRPPAPGAPDVPVQRPGYCPTCDRAPCACEPDGGAA